MSSRHNNWDKVQEQRGCVLVIILAIAATAVFLATKGGDPGSSYVRSIDYGPGSVSVNVYNEVRSNGAFEKAYLLEANEPGQSLSEQFYFEKTAADFPACFIEAGLKIVEEASLEGRGGREYFTFDKAEANHSYRVVAICQYNGKIYNVVQRDITIGKEMQHLPISGG